VFLKDQLFGAKWRAMTPEEKKVYEIKASLLNAEQRSNDSMAENQDEKTISMES